jgi:hypothetical protein
MKYLAAFVFVLSLGCAHTGPVTGAATCDTACVNQIKLGCIPATTPQGHSCVEVCTNAMQSVPWDVAGLTTASVCP